LKKNQNTTRKVFELLQDQIKDHEAGKCNCNLTDGGYGLCYAGQFLEGIISPEDVLKDLAWKCTIVGVRKDGAE